ncbi:MAG: hypothetical protein KDN19_01390 [Verrucomicrobiae bacterium]|nr:hypothetical protein [Verrucomicrobiae bacterium]
MPERVQTGAENPLATPGRSVTLTTLFRGGNAIQSAPIQRKVYDAAVFGESSISLTIIHSPTYEMKRTTAILALAASLLTSGNLLHAEDAEITIHADKIQLAYDTKEFTVKTGQKVKVTFINPADSQNLQPHNFILAKPGKLNAMIALVSDPSKLADPNWIANPIPETDDMLYHTKLLKPGEQETIEFTAPAPGDYPYLCSYIGHAAIMNGVMKVTE